MNYICTRTKSGNEKAYQNSHSSKPTDCTSVGLPIGIYTNMKKPLLTRLYSNKAISNNKIPLF